MKASHETHVQNCFWGILVLKARSVLHVQLSPKEEAAHRLRALEGYQRAADEANLLDMSSDKKSSLPLPPPLIGGPRASPIPTRFLAASLLQ